VDQEEQEHLAEQVDVVAQRDQVDQVDQEEPAEPVDQVGQEELAAAAAAVLELNQDNIRQEQAAAAPEYQLAAEAPDHITVIMLVLVKAEIITNLDIVVIHIFQEQPEVVLPQVAVDQVKEDLGVV